MYLFQFRTLAKYVGSQGLVELGVLLTSSFLRVIYFSRTLLTKLDSEEIYNLYILNFIKIKNPKAYNW